MGLFGRESEAQRQRAEAVRRWAQARSPYALVSALLGVLALVDFFTPLAWVLGPAAVVLAVMGLRDLARRPGLVGARLCYLGAACGAVGAALSAALWVFVY